jgi:hypothetical protein
LRGNSWPGNIAPQEFRSSRRIGNASNGWDVILAFAKRGAGFGLRRRIEDFSNQCRCALLQKLTAHRAIALTVPGEVEGLTILGTTFNP